ncbi:unnamed protein product, partial [Pylaiella littoralis]
WVLTYCRQQQIPATAAAAPEGLTLICNDALGASVLQLRMAAAAVACSSSSRSRIRGRANAAGPLASRLLFFLLLASAPCRGRSFLLGSCGGGGVATTTSDRTTSYYFGVRRGGGDRDRHTDRHDAAPCRERGRAGLVLGMGSRGVANEG